MIIKEKKNTNDILFIDILDGFFVNNIYVELVLYTLSKNFLSIFKIIFYFLTNRNKFNQLLFNTNLRHFASIPIRHSVKEIIKAWLESGGKVKIISPINDKLIKNIDFGFQYDQHLNSINDEMQTYQNQKYNLKNNFFTISKNISNKFNIFNFLSLEKDKIKFTSYIEQLRPKHWVKNLLVFTPLLLLNKFEISVFINCLYAFVIFSYFASCVYIFNDLLDISSDRENNLKKNRPLASGSASLVFFISILPLMFLIGILTTYLYFIELLPLIISYVFISLSYSIFLKKKVLIDIIILSSLYTTRLLIGAEAAFMSVSFWILAFSVFIFIALASIKRFSEKSYIQNLEMNNLSRRGYAIEDIKILEQISLIASFAACIIFAIYINTTELTNLVLNIQSLWFICIIILYWLLRLNLIARRHSFFGDPLEFSLNDRVSYICLFLIILFYINGTIGFSFLS